MAKRKFDDLSSKALSSVNKETQMEQAKEAFKTFMDKETPNEVNAYDWTGREVLIEIFSFEPDDEFADTLKGEGMGTILDKVRYFSLAKVLAAGTDSVYKTNDIVKLKDRETLSLESSAYQNWVKNDYSKSNLKQKGKEPSRFMSNIFQTYGAFAWVLNPLDIKSLDQGEDSGLYKITDAKIENKVKDVNILLNSI